MIDRQGIEEGKIGGLAQKKEGTGKYGGFNSKRMRSKRKTEIGKEESEVEEESIIATEVSTELERLIEAAYLYGGQELDMVFSKVRAQRLLIKILQVYLDQSEQLLSWKEEGALRNSDIWSKRVGEIGRPREGDGRLPERQIVKEVEHSPPERIVIFKNAVTGVEATKSETDEFRKQIVEVAGARICKEISVVKATRKGGFVVVMSNNRSREELIAEVRDKDAYDMQLVVTPQQKRSRVICRRPPEEDTRQVVIRDMYNRHNRWLAGVPLSKRYFVIVITKIGWIAEASSEVAYAISQQGGRVRYGGGQEILFYEYIPIQQCFRCCRFGHIAGECRSKEEKCRFCGVVGHGGHECRERRDRTKWRCTNCDFMNREYGLRLDCNHGASQTNICEVARYERNNKRKQLNAAGVWVGSMEEEEKITEEVQRKRDSERKVRLARRDEGRITEWRSNRGNMGEETLEVGDEVMEVETPDVLSKVVGVGKTVKTPMLRLARVRAEQKKRDEEAIRKAVDALRGSKKGEKTVISGSSSRVGLVNSGALSKVGTGSSGTSSKVGLKAGGGEVFAGRKEGFVHSTKDGSTSKVGVKVGEIASSRREAGDYNGKEVRVGKSQNDKAGSGSTSRLSKSREGSTSSLTKSGTSLPPCAPPPKREGAGA